MICDDKLHGVINGIPSGSWVLSLNLQYGLASVAEITLLLGYFCRTKRQNFGLSTGDYPSECMFSTDELSYCF